MYIGATHLKHQSGPNSAYAIPEGMKVDDILLPRPGLKLWDIDMKRISEVSYVDVDYDLNQIFIEVVHEGKMTDTMQMERVGLKTYGSWFVDYEDYLLHPNHYVSRQPTTPTKYSAQGPSMYGDDFDYEGGAAWGWGM